VTVGLVAVTAAGRRHAAAVADAWPHARLVPGDTAAAALRHAWSSCDAIVAFLAAGAVVRILAPLIGDKSRDPAVVVVDEAARHAVALLGGHAAGANALAEEVAALLDARPVLTTATDVAGLPGLDTLGWPVEGAVAAVSRAMLDGLPVRLEADASWPLPALPATVTPDAGGDGVPRLLVTDRIVQADPRTAVLRPPSLVAGIGASRGVSSAEVLGLLDRVLSGAGLSRSSVRCLATADIKAGEPGIAEVAGELGVPLVTHPADALAGVTVPHPSEVVRAAVGTPSVAEAAALLGDALHAGTVVEAGTELVAPKTASAMATVAIARHPPRGRLAIVGLGPGARDLLTPRARAELRRASVVVGLDQYVDQVRDLLRPGTRMLSSGLGEEQARAEDAVREARAGHAVALVGSGDAGVYAMASPALEIAGSEIEVVGVPGVTAGLAASALLGAPLGHDHALISLSDLHTPWEVIEQRVAAAAAGDFVVVFYNPRSRSRDWQLAAALKLLGEHRPGDVPVGVVRHATRPQQQVTVTTLAAFDPAVVDMNSVVVVGSSQTRIAAGRIVTARGYRWRS
jgi:cobalt-precorrin 5A hydrolase/precorrin-3B C17-methyltransferase